MTAEGLKTLDETELQSEVDNLGLGSEERQGLRQLLSASKRMNPGELHEQWRKLVPEVQSAAPYRRPPRLGWRAPAQPAQAAERVTVSPWPAV